MWYQEALQNTLVMQQVKQVSSLWARVAVTYYKFSLFVCYCCYIFLPFLCGFSRSLPFQFFLFLFVCFYFHFPSVVSISFPPSLLPSIVCLFFCFVLFFGGLSVPRVYSFMCVWVGSVLIFSHLLFFLLFSLCQFRLPLSFFTLCLSISALPWLCVYVYLAKRNNKVGTADSSVYLFPWQQTHESQTQGFSSITIHKLIKIHETDCRCTVFTFFYTFIKILQSHSLTFIVTYGKLWKWC